MGRRLTEHVAGASLQAHGLALLVVLVALLPVVGTSASYSADEGAAIIQARSLARGDGWEIEHPLPEVDPDGSLFPLELASAGPDGTAAFAKHPVYPLLLAAADRVGGHLAMVLLSVAGTWLAALGAARLAREVLGGGARTALWLTGAGSPLLFDAYWVIAHSIAAALIAWAAVAVVRVLRPGGGQALVWLPLLVAAAVLLRTEAAIAGLALGGAALIVAVVRRDPRLASAAALAGIAAVAARALDGGLERLVLDGPVADTGPFLARPAAGRADGVVDAFVTTWLRPVPASEAGSTAAVLLVVGVTALAVGALLLRRRAGAPATMILCVGGGLVLARAVVLPAAAVPGLLVAFPLLLVALAGVPDAPASHRPAGVIVGGTLVLFWAGVLVTQYAEGGVAEWGGRYFALGLPLAAVVVAGGLHPLVERTAASQRPIVIGALVAAVVGLSLAAVLELRRVHRDTDDVLDEIAALAAQADDAVIVTDAAPLPRLDWARFDSHRWLLVDPAQDPQLPARLAAAGVDRFVLVSADAPAALAAFDDVEVIDEARPTVLLVEHTPP